MWRKREDFEPGTNFKAWAFQTAFYTVKNYRRRQARAKEMSLPNEQLLDRLVDRVGEADGRWDEEVELLPLCLSGLPERQRELVVRRYVAKVSVQELAAEQGITPNAMSQKLFRIKAALRKCVEKRLAAQRKGK